MSYVNPNWLDELRDIVRMNYHFVIAPIKVSTLNTLLNIIDNLMDENDGLQTCQNQEIDPFNTIDDLVDEVERLKLQVKELENRNE